MNEMRLKLLFLKMNKLLKRHRKWVGNKRVNKACLGKYKIFEKVLPKAGLLGVYPCIRAITSTSLESYNL